MRVRSRAICDRPDSILMRIVAVGSTIAALLLLVVPGGALAADNPASGGAASVAPETRDAEAHKECLDGRFERGIAILGQIYAETGDATYIYNQGRCYQQNARPDEALGRYLEYKRIGGAALAPGDLDDANVRIRECELMRAKTRSQANGADRGDLRRSIGKATIALGLVAIAGAVASGIAVESIERAAEREPETAPDRKKSGNRFELLQWIGYGVGGAALIGGTALVVTAKPGEGAVVALQVPW